MGKTAKTKSKVKVHRIIENRTDFFYYAFRNILLVSVPLLVISALVLSHLSFHTSADNPNNGSGSSTDSLTFSISSSCTLSSVVDSNHNAELNNGIYVDGIGKTTITTLCNDGNGYSIYAVGYSNNEEGNNQLVNSVNSNFNIDTGLATSGLTSNWAMSLNHVVDDTSPTPPEIEDDYNSTYGLIPNEWTKVASLPSRSTDMVKGSSFTTTYAVYTSSFQNAGTYNGQVKYMLVHPSYKPAVYFMQDVAEWKNMLAMEESVQAVDKRDGKTYWVTKLKDGNVWMTQNLDFDIEANTTLSSQTTDLNVAYDSSTGEYAEYSDGYTESNGVIYYAPASSATTIDFQNTGPIIGWQNSNTAPYTANKTDSTETGHASLGNYYNWTAAIASNNSSSLAQDTLSDISKNPKNSICPKGWRLPTISNESETLPSSTNEFGRLNYLYNNNSTSNSDGFAIEPLYFIYGGLINNRILYIDMRNGGGNYRSSTVSSSLSSYRLAITDSLTNVADGSEWSAKNRGMSIRCLVK